MISLYGMLQLWNDDKKKIFFSRYGRNSVPKLLLTFGAGVDLTRVAHIDGTPMQVLAGIKRM